MPGTREEGHLMPWFKVDDKLHDHRKARAAGAAAMGVWVLAGSWAADNLTDGFIPSSLLPRWGRQREANRLVEVGLWHPDEQDGEAGWRFHEWDERQPTRAQKLAEREAKVEAGRIGGLRSGRSRREASAKQSATGQVELPSRPVPTRPKEEEPSRAKALEETDRFEEFWDTYSHKIGRKKAETAYHAALKKPGVTETLLIASAAAYITWQTSEGKHPTYTKHPATWLHGEHWRDERSARAAPMTNVQRHLQLAADLAASERQPQPRQIGPSA
jgi:hypothetical protein